MKPRSCETVLVESKHKDLAPLGSQLHVTPDEARFLTLVGRASLVNVEQPVYPTRQMVATQSRHSSKRDQKGLKDEVA